jgi:hypothetical protein
MKRRQRLILDVLHIFALKINKRKSLDRIFFLLAEKSAIFK